MFQAKSVKLLETIGRFHFLGTIHRRRSKIHKTRKRFKLLFRHRLRVSRNCHKWTSLCLSNVFCIIISMMLEMTLPTASKLKFFFHRPWSIQHETWSQLVVARIFVSLLFQLDHYRHHCKLNIMFCRSKVNVYCSGKCALSVCVCVCNTTKYATVQYLTISTNIP